MKILGWQTYRFCPPPPLTIISRTVIQNRFKSTVRHYKTIKLLRRRRKFAIFLLLPPIPNMDRRPSLTLVNATLLQTRVVDPGGGGGGAGAGGSRPPPPHDNIGGGANISFAPPPPIISTLEKLIICMQE